MKVTKIITIIVLLAAVGVGVYYVVTHPAVTPDNLIDNANQPVVEDKSDLIIVDVPTAGQVVTSPLTISGKARGYWYFEASFPIVLRDSQGNTVASGIAQAIDDWMTEEFVPFSTNLTFIAQPTSSEGQLILSKDNPSGLPEHDDQLIIPVKFDLSQPVVVTPCMATGCSNHVCSDQEVITTCEFNPAYACYTQAVCERQLNGECAWTQTFDLNTCLAEFN